MSSTNQEHRLIYSLPAHGSCAVVTSLIYSRRRIITASDDHSIHVYSSTTGGLIWALDGHEGGVWALAAHKDALVSGSTDKTVRIWDLLTGKCTHLFRGHTATVRCLTIVKSEMEDVEREDFVVVKEKLPEKPLIITGSRDKTLKVWSLPQSGDPEYQCDEDQEDIHQNPFYKLSLEGHDQPVRALAAKGSTAVSGSYDSTVRVWDPTTGRCKWILRGHTDKVYDVILDTKRNQTYSSSMDSTIRIWSLSNGTCLHVLTGHDSLVGIINLSPNFLVSGSADSTLRVWDPETGELKHILSGNPTAAAVSCFDHDDSTVISGSNDGLKIWTIQGGTLSVNNENFVTDSVTGVWKVLWKHKRCIAAVDRNDQVMLDVWQFGTAEEEEGPSDEDDEVVPA